MVKSSQNRVTPPLAESSISNLFLQTRCQSLSYSFFCPMTYFGCPKKVSTFEHLFELLNKFSFVNFEFAIFKLKFWYIVIQNQFSLAKPNIVRPSKAELSISSIKTIASTNRRSLLGFPRLSCNSRELWLSEVNIVKK